MSKNAITIQGLSKTYEINPSQGNQLRHAIPSFFKSLGTNSKIHALDNISLEVPVGQVLGVCGPNGSGKSTLLKILSKITPPTRGRCTLQGRVSSLLEVGTGFHHELSGRENIFLNGAILGMTKKDIQQQLDSIIVFSEIEKFIDIPIKHYSSGMQVRLAFSVAAHLDAEILLLDEVLSVGDIHFQNKCLNKVSSIAQDGKTIVLVSHNLSALKTFAQRAILMSSGQIVADGNTSNVLSSYISAFTHTDTRLKITPVVEEQNLVLNISLNNDESLSFSKIVVFIQDSSGQIIYKVSSSHQLNSPFLLTKSSNLQCTVSNHQLYSGQYRILYNLSVDGKQLERRTASATFVIPRTSWEPLRPEGIQSQNVWKIVCR